MKKSMVVTAILALVLSLVVGVAAAANCGKCPSDKAGKGGCKGKTADSACCKHQGTMEEAMKALEADLAKMEKGVPKEEMDAFMKAHQANLKKFVDAHAQCMKACKTKGDSKKDAKEAPKS